MDFAYTVCVCVVCMIPFVNVINLLVFVLRMQCVFLCVETEFLSLICMKSGLKRLYGFM